MTKIKENELRLRALTQVAEKMVIAARTAPKGKGVDNMEMLILTANDVTLLAKKMKEIGEQENNEIFLRDAYNVLTSAEVVVLMGTRIQALGLKFCGLCGFEDCNEKNLHPDVPCSFNTTDLGIAMGSAVSVAMDHRVDNRIMYTIGMAALHLELFDKEVKIIWGVPLSAGSKNPFFDRRKQ
ncbi:MAG: DUF2148 domain-containing protein [Bacteroidales bacterium]